MDEPVKFLKSLFEVAVKAARPESCLPHYLPQQPKGRCIRRDRLWVPGAGAQKMLDEEHDEVKLMNSIVNEAKCFTILDRQCDALVGPHRRHEHNDHRLAPLQ